MQTQMKMLFGTLIAGCLLGCGSAADPAASLPLPEGEDTVTGNAGYSFFVADTVSNDLLAEYGIAFVDDISASSSGFIALLDGVNSTITVIDPQGNAITTGGSGSGPGEYQWPKAIAVSGNGSLAVSDFMGGFVRILMPGLGSWEDIDGFIMQNPGRMFLPESGDLAGMRITFRTEDGESFIGHQTALWTPPASDPAIVYSESLRPFSLNDFGWTLTAPYPMTCSDAGIVYTAEVSTEIYALHSYAPDGTEQWSVRRPFVPVEKTQEEIEIEEEMVRRLMQQSEHQADFTPDPYHFAVSELALGPEGNLWAARPSAENTFFDVFQPDSGSYLFSVSTDARYQFIRVTPAGVLAVPEGNEPPLLMLDIQPLTAASN